MARVLVVDDDPDIRYAAELVLRRGGHVVSSVCDGKGALAFFDGAGTCDLVLCDRMMPNLNGLQLLRALRERPMAQPRFLFLSAQVLPGEIDEARRLGADGYLAKPFEPKELLAEIARLMGG